MQHLRSLVLALLGTLAARAEGWVLANLTPAAFEVRQDSLLASGSGLELILIPAQGPPESFRFEARRTVPGALVLRPGGVLCFPGLDPASTACMYWFELVPEGAPAAEEAGYLLYHACCPIWSRPRMRLAGAFYARFSPSPWRLHSPAHGLLQMEPAAASTSWSCILQ